jgi:hypothetical protein
MGRVGGQKATELLWKKIDYPDRLIVSEVLNSLSYMGFEAKDHQKARIQLVIEDLIGNIAWNTKTLEDIPNIEDLDIMLREALKEENKVNYDNIFMLLSMIYDPQNVKLVKENIEADTTDSVMFACEMLDVFIDDELKPKILPVMDDLKAKDRLERLISYYPPEEFESYEDLLKQVVNRDYNRITRYTKALSMFRILRLGYNEVSNDLIANLFNPDPILRETAALVIYEMDHSAYHYHVKRLKPSIKKDLDRAILPPVYLQEGEEYHQELRYIERLLQFKNMVEFEEIPGEVICYLVESVEEIRVPAGTALIKKGDPGNTPIYIILKGKIEMTDAAGEKKTLGRNSLFGDSRLLESEQYDIEAHCIEDCTMLLIRKEELFNLMSMHIDIADIFIKIINHDFRKQEEEKFDLSIFN